jgi:hypothetical protein
MLNLVEQPGFDYGYPKSNPKLGLWCPLFDCFLMVGDDYNHLADIQLLTSSKILTMLVELEISSNDSNMIDNEVCSNWTIPEPESINFTLVFKKINTGVPSFPISAKVLNNPEEVNKIQVWFTFVSSWVTQLNNRSKLNRAIKFINFVMDINPDDQLKQKIYKILLLGDDCDTINKQIKQLL